MFTYAETDNINYTQLIELKAKYWELLKANPFSPAPISGDSIEMIKYFKRKINGNHKPIGPYKNISVFEAANRIASDLVILNGILQIIEEAKEPKDSTITVRLGNTHIKDHGDFTINNKEGEAFNVAASFYKAKLRNTNTKWKKLELAYILVNADVFDEIEGKNLAEKIIKVNNWDKQ